MTKTEAFWQDEQGQPCSPADAVTGEIIEYDDDGVELQRTYVDHRNSESISTDDQEDLLPENQDLLKQGTWDIWWVDEAGVYHLLESLDRLFVFLGVAGVADVQARREAVGRFMTLPAWKAAPPALESEVGDWLVATRQTGA